jgi:hypothetical protein
MILILEIKNEVFKNPNKYAGKSLGIVGTWEAVRKVDM